MALKAFHLRSSKAHAALSALAETDGEKHLLDLFQSDANRVKKFSAELGPIFVDWSKNRITSDVLKQLIELAEEADWKGAVDQFFEGDTINQTESRAVLHMALRANENDAFQVNGIDVLPSVLQTRKEMLAFADAVRSNPTIKDVINIGIGGSDLGPLMVTKALRNEGKSGPKVHFVSNVDGAHLASTLDNLKPESTLVIVVSKTFTTQETMANAQAAKEWLIDSLGEGAIGAHFAAVSTNVEAALNFGVPKSSIFGFDDWVGGRYSLWGPVGLSIACAVGSKSFEALLDGARAMDLHFRTAPPEQNIPLISALIGIWYREYLRLPTHVILPYAQDLDRFPAYLQQADMESNGKSMGRDGKAVKHATGPVVWGEAGTNGQHAFYQLLHQGTDVHPVDIIAVKQPMSIYGDHHQKLLANAVAQAEALMRGRTVDEVRQSMLESGLSLQQVDEIAPHRVFDGNRPSTFYLLDQLDAKSLGMLIALYEHRIFIQGLIWNVCSFDQWGVELGKVLANQVLKELTSESSQVPHDESTQGLIDRLKN